MKEIEKSGKFVSCVIVSEKVGIRLAKKWLISLMQRLRDNFEDILKVATSWIRPKRS